ncbi:MAG TPA: hypothetical protein VHC19_18910 [Pirellulales bacterium]|nr:hypothetical protein [Pirellulales bacterium]
MTVSEPAPEVSKPATEMTESDYAVPDVQPPPFAVEYTDPRQSTLTAEVKADGENNFDFELKE